jgi:hypothetical protein
MLGITAIAQVPIAAEPFTPFVYIIMGQIWM